MSYEEDNDLVRSIAYRITRYNPQLFDDAISAGWVGLLEAKSRKTADKTQENTWYSYAAMRIRGAIIDMLRSQDHYNRRHRTFSKKMELARKALVRTLNREPSQEELSASMGISLEKFQTLQSEMISSFRIQVDTDINLEDGSSLEELLMNEDMLHKAFALFNKMPSRYRFIAQSYYMENRNFVEIGADLGVTPAMVSRLHRDIMLFLRPVLFSEESNNERKRLVFMARLERGESLESSSSEEIP